MDVFRKVTVAAEIVLQRSLPGILDGSAPRTAQDLARGSYFGGRKPDDGRIDWSKGARAIHDLVRAVAPPYPGAFTDLGGRRLRIDRTRVLDERGAAAPARLRIADTHAIIECVDGGHLHILEMALDGHECDARGLLQHFGPGPHLL